MAQIFISYAREDAARVEPLAGALGKQGWSVFWDRQIPAGKTWRSHIGEAIRGAGCVLVVWTHSSVGSQWVQEEAEEGKSRGILIPIFLDAVDPPLGFRGIQAADLTGWEPGRRSGGFKGLVRDIRDTLEPRVVHGTRPSRQPKRRRSWFSRLVKLGVGAVLLYVVGALLLNLSWFPQAPPDPDPPGTYSTPYSTPYATPYASEPAPQIEALAPAPVPRGDQVYVVVHQHQGRGVQVVDTGERRVVGTIPIPDLTTVKMSLNRQRRELYVALNEGGAFYFLDLPGWRIRHVTSEQVGWNSFESAVSPDGATVYLATSGGSPPENKILEFDVASGGLRRVFRIGPYQYPRALQGLVLSPDGTRLLTVDGTSQQLVTIEAVGGSVVQRFSTPVYRVAGPSPSGDAYYAIGPGGLSKVHVDGGYSIWHHPDAQVGDLATTGGLVAFADARQFVSILNDQSGAILHRVFTQANAIAFSRDGSRLYTVAGGGPNSNWLGIFEVSTGNLIDSIGLLPGGAPLDIEVL